ncbi:hypothetical protein A5883_002095, partial [Enterococcus sp. 5B3_DIV0040]
KTRIGKPMSDRLVIASSVFQDDSNFSF